MAGVMSSPAAHDASPPPDGAEAEAAQTGAAEARRIRRPRDMALSLGLLLIPILLIVAIGRFFYGDTTTATVDPSVALSGAARASMSPLPQGTVPDGWKLVNAAYRDGVLRLGYLTEHDQGIQLVQGSGNPDELIRTELTRTGHETGQVEVAGASWQRWTGRAGESALVRRDGAVTVIVVGAVGEADLVKLVTTVRG
jgi:hypothetical protein